jgi:hypothetical protein
MRQWVHSRSLQRGTLTAIGLLTVGTCGGAALANYTVAGMNPLYVARAERVTAPPSRGAADWLAEEAFRDVERDRNKAAFADPWKPETAD